MLCIVLDDYQGAALGYAAWDSLDGVEVRSISEHLVGDALVDALADAEFVVVMRERTPLPRTLLERLPRLRLIVTTGMNNTAIDQHAARELGITVCGTASDLAPPAELTWALILGLARGLHLETEAMRSDGPWQQTIGTDLAGATLGVVGLGNVGSRVAKVGTAFGMEVVAWSPHLTEARASDAGVVLASSLDELVSRADVVTLHLKLGDRSRNIIDERVLSLMQPSAFLVNTARAALVDETALIAALEAGRIAGAGLDVFGEEPLPGGHPFRSLKNVLATPHLGYVAHGNYRQYFVEAVEDIHAFLQGSPVRVLDERV